MALRKFFYLGLLLLILCSGIAQAEDLTFRGFSSLNGLQFASDPDNPGVPKVVSTQDGNAVRLTEELAGNYDSSGRVYATSQQPLNGFSEFFSFRITQNYRRAIENACLISGEDFSGGDGLAFIVQSESLAYTDDQVVFVPEMYIPWNRHSAIVEFDTNDCLPLVSNPTISNGLRIIANPGAAIDLAAKEIRPEFDDGSRWYAWIDYDGTSLDVRVSQNGYRPEQPQLHQAINLAATLYGATGTAASTGYFGFSSSSGSLTPQTVGLTEHSGTHDISIWQHRARYQPITDIDRLFAWAEDALPNLLTPKGSPTLEIAGYFARHYGPQGHGFYIGIKDGIVALYDESTGSFSPNIGSFDSFFQQALAANY